MKIRIAAGLSALLLLSGCFGGRHDLVIHEDGTATQRTTMGVHALSTESYWAQDLAEFCSRRVERAPKDLNGAVKYAKGRADLFCTIDFGGPTEKLLAFLSEQNQTTTVVDELAEQLRMTASKNDGKIRLDVVIRPASGLSRNDRLMRHMFAGEAAGRRLELNITAPQIIETTGTLSADGKTSSYSMRMSDFLTNETETFQFSVVFLDKALE